MPIILVLVRCVGPYSADSMRMNLRSPAWYSVQAGKRKDTRIYH